MARQGRSADDVHMAPAVVRSPAIPPPGPAGTAQGERASVDAIVRPTFDTAPDGLVVMDAQGRQLAYNASYVAMWGIPADMRARQDSAAMRAFIASQLRPAADGPAAMERLRSTQGSANVQTFELQDGRCFERNLSPLQDAGYPGTLVERWRDVTEQRRVARALAEATTRLAAVFNHARNAILLADDHGAYVDANPAACVLMGRSVEQLRALTVAEALNMPPHDAQQQWQAFLQGGTASGQITLHRPDGSTREAWFEAVAHIQPGLHLSVLNDVTDEVLARRRQTETAAQMETAMANADIVFWVVDLEADRVSAAHPDWLQQTLGYEPGDLPESQGAWDALVHPEDWDRREDAWQAHVQGRAASYEAEFRMRHKNGQWIWLQVRGKATARDASGMATRVAGTRIDITRRKQAEHLLERQAYSDSLTGTLNRRRFLQLAAVEIERSRRHRQPLALLMIDLDHFKTVNDTHGHAIGDQVLCAFVQSALTVMRGSDLFGRMGGEEFAALLPQTDRDGALALAQRLRQRVKEQPVALPSGLVRYTVSIGVTAPSVQDAPGPALESMLLTADKALYEAKFSGRDQVRLADAGC